MGLLELFLLAVGAGFFMGLAHITYRIYGQYI